ncbi:MAG: hypothetical protein AMS18_12415 [Gemmatimonas sp. SG8_17]|nr:MAG: hypothetical protein AMS18_12415 [Gemmatimonas sp. SG8_17]
MSQTRVLAPIAAFALLCCSAAAAQQKIYWGNEVPEGWNGEWPAELQTIAEKTNFTRTMSIEDLHEFIDAIKWRSEHVHVFDLFTTTLGRISPAIVLANPRVTSPEQADSSGKPVVYLQGKIHPPEPEGAEAMLILLRDILFGERKHLLDNQIIIMTPIFNADGTGTLSTRDRAPFVGGQRTNATGYDINRDAVKLETVEMNGLFERLLNPWDPILLYDSHRMGRGNFAYSIAYVNCTVPAAHPGPRQYVRDNLFPEVRARVRSEFGLEPFTHALWQGDEWPPKVWHHDATIWSVEAKFLANAYGLRNRMSILAETPGAASFERQVYSQYAYITSLVEYTNAHGAEMQRVAKQADDETVQQVLDGAEAGTLRNWLDGEYQSRGTIDILAYRDGFPDVETAYLPGTSIRTHVRPSGPPEVVHGVADMTKPVGTADTWMPRGYLIPAELEFLVTKLKTQNIDVVALEEPMQAEGEEFVIDRMLKVESGGYNMTVLEGGFYGPSVREFPAGSYFVDMAQPMANAAFYFMEPQSRDGFVGWGVLDETLRALGAAERPIVYPVFKYRRKIDD